MEYHQQSHTKLASRKYKCNLATICLQFAWLNIALIPGVSMSQTVDLPAGKSEYRYNQSVGSSSSVAVGITSSFGVSSSAQASPGYNAASSASLILNTDPGVAQIGGATMPNYNSSIQTVGTEANNSPVNVKINSQTLQVKATDGSSSQETVGSKQLTNATNFSDSGDSSSKAEFAAEGFGAIQDLRFRGGSADGNTVGSRFTADVVPILKIDESGNTSTGSNYITGSASSNAESKTRMQADITTSTFVSAFVSSF